MKSTEKELEISLMVDVEGVWEYDTIIALLAIEHMGKAFWRIFQVTPSQVKC